MTDSSSLNHSEPWAKTFQVLANTGNEAATTVLATALDSPRESIQCAALECLLERRDATSRRAIVARLHAAPPAWLAIIAARPGCLAAALADGLAGNNLAFAIQACEAIRTLRAFGLIPALVAALTGDGTPDVSCRENSTDRSKLWGETLLALVDALCEALGQEASDETSATEMHSAKPMPELAAAVARAAKQPALASLEAAMQSLDGRGRSLDGRGQTAIIEAFLQLAERDNATLRQILHDEQHDAFAPVVDTLQHGAHPAVVRLLVSLLDDPHLPAAAMAAISRRSDREFALALLHSASVKLSPEAAHNLQSIRSLAWLPLMTADLDALDELQQAGLVAVLVASGVDRGDVWKGVEHCGTYGKPRARAAAIDALTEFHSPQADALIFRAADDADPRVQAAALPQIRPRGMPGAIARLIALTDSPHECIRVAVGEGLAEFSFHQYVATLEMLDEESRRTTGRLVRKINPQCVSVLADEMQMPSRQRRLRALSITMSMGIVAELETAVTQLLTDCDPTIRAQAVFALGQCHTSTASSALNEALSDESLTVRQAAHEMLASCEAARHTEEFTPVEHRP